MSVRALPSLVFLGVNPKKKRIWALPALSDRTTYSLVEPDFATHLHPKKKETAWKQFFLNGDTARFETSIFCILWWREAQLLVAKRERWRASLPGWWIKKWMKGWKILPRGRSLNGMHLQREIEMPLLPKVHPDKATLPEESSHFLIWSLSAVLFTILSSSDLGSWSRSQEKRDDHSKGEGSDKRRWWGRPEDGILTSRSGDFER